MKMLLSGLFALISSSLMASDLPTRALSLNKFCNKSLKINTGIYKIEQGCKVELTEKQTPELEGVCRGQLRTKGHQNISYKIIFSTKHSSEKLDFIAVTDDSLWNIEENIRPEIISYQPTWMEFRNQRYVVVNKKKSSKLTMGHQNLIHLKSDDIDLVMLYGRMGLSNIRPYLASIVVKTHQGELELKDANCEVLSLK